ncbi:MAG: hypothetical protein GFH27_549331n113 [Chloroflexi bacterium AL-W]|nr:hypothetical protein [Chloroflexi bacterium AL-N1]NOK70413.1 hypothetical protein [Chloroflexi bacterium AL-N10]NOK78091.1 hypothetical protein [Chloroflexi bacterium AL-N5]NOK85190.1 hypothetical protein [Chloroflexi bacterium AL-W]NOK92179.1 hypothetical protein [Chloroflexi bacterium AL-N15]
MLGEGLSFRIRILAILHFCTTILTFSLGATLLGIVSSAMVILASLSGALAIVLYFVSNTHFATVAVYVHLVILLCMIAAVEIVAGQTSGAVWVLFQIFPALTVLILRQPQSALIAATISVLILTTLVLLELNNLVPVQLLVAVPILLFNFGLQIFTLLALSTVIAIISQSERRALEQTLQAQMEAQAQLDHVQRLLTEKEQLNIKLEDNLEEVHERERQVVEAQVRERQLDQTIQALMSPIIPVTDDVIIVPLVGEFDDHRLHSTGAAIIRGIEQHRAKILVLDTTGISLISEHLAQMIVQTARAAQLLGTMPILVGLRPELAQSLVAMNIELESLVTYADLREAIRFALNKVDQRTV